jgi:hypothetical protein
MVFFPILLFHRHETQQQSLFTSLLTNSSLLSHYTFLVTAFALCSLYTVNELC